ncbi:MAG: zinc-ribbon domain-containing protein [Lachnospiraceae bacterium]|nr:zinc-ribbon domain-containing protein [Lachnospiraceae bacterium]
MKSFADTYPELKEEWSDDNELKPDEVSYGSNKKVFWLGACGHTWEAAVKNRGNGHGCPYCSGNRVLKGFNDLDTTDPGLASEWDEKNFPFSPDMVSGSSNRKVWWKCPTCSYIWKARIADRSAGHGCPVCTGEKLVSGINDLASLYPKLVQEWSGKNKESPDKIRPKSREKVWWHCGICGAEYQAIIDSRVKGLKCPVCRQRARAERRPYYDKKEETGFKTKAIKYYAEKAGAEVLFESDEAVGIPLEIYLPEQKAAIIFSQSLVREYRVRRENAVNWLCLNAGIRLIRFLPKGAGEYQNCICITLEDRRPDLFGAALQEVFILLKLQTDVDIERDSMEIKKTAFGPSVRKWKEIDMKKIRLKEALLPMTGEKKA